MRMLLPEPRETLTDDDLDAAYSWPTDGQPWLRANMVSTADGAARSPDGRSEGISSAVDKRVFGRLRAYCDVVLVGAGTARAEGYRPARVRPAVAPVRLARGQSEVPAIAVVSRSLHLDLASELFAQARVRTLVVTCGTADPVLLARTREVADVVVAGADDVDLPAALAALRERGLAHVLAEGGPQLLADLAAGSLLDELDLTVSPLLAGGSYPDLPRLPRILDGASLAQPPLALRLRHVLEDEGTLFLRYDRS